MLEFPSVVRLSGYPFGYIVTNKKQNFGLLRILKNASTELTTAFRCLEWMPSSEFQGPRACFLRDPVDRLLSAIPETLIHIREPLHFERASHSPVFEHTDIYEHLRANARHSIKAFVQAYLDIIRLGFFDPHHCPQWHFISNWKGESLGDPHVYLVERLPEAVADVVARFQIEPQDLGHYNRGDSRIAVHSRLRQRIKRVLGMPNLYDPVDPEHPLLVVAKFDLGGLLAKKNALTRWDLFRAAEQIYPAIKSLRKDPEIRLAIVDVYALDKTLHEAATRSPLGSRLSTLLRDIGSA